jgi:hypothetical protein
LKGFVVSVPVVAPVLYDVTVLSARIAPQWRPPGSGVLNKIRTESPPTDFASRPM